MNHKNLYLTVGISGSGKSTALYKLAEKNPNAVIVSRDTIRFQLIGENDSYFAKEKEVFKQYVEKIQRFLDNGYDVYADATHLNYASRKKLLSNLKIDNNTRINILYFRVPLSVCIERNSVRSGMAFVPLEVIKRQFQNLKFPTFAEIDELHYYSISTLNEKGADSYA